MHDLRVQLDDSVVYFACLAKAFAIHQMVCQDNLDCQLVRQTFSQPGGGLIDRNGLVNLPAFDQEARLTQLGNVSFGTGLYGGRVIIDCSVEIPRHRVKIGLQHRFCVTALRMIQLADNPAIELMIVG
jgi:hypothetical protein